MVSVATLLQFVTERAAFQHLREAQTSADEPPLPSGDRSHFHQRNHRSRDRGGGYSKRHSPSREPTSQTATACFNIQTKEVIPLRQKHGKSRRCSYCSKDHWLSFCPTFRPLTTTERERWVIDNFLCPRCGEPHLRTECTLKTECLVCSRNHVTALHEINLG